MLVRLALVIEIISMVICVHRIYGKRIQWDILTIGFAVAVLIVLDAINTLHMDKMASELSEYLDYTNERQLQRIESGETACSVDKLMEVAQILETSVLYC